MGQELETLSTSGRTKAVTDYAPDFAPTPFSQTGRKQSFLMKRINSLPARLKSGPAVVTPIESDVDGKYHCLESDAV